MAAIKTLWRKSIPGALAGLLLILLPGAAIAEIVLAEGITSGLVLEAEIPWETNDAESTGDIVLATFELSLDAEPVQGVIGHAVLLWEEDESEGIVVDEATITLGGAWMSDFYLETGLKGIPFGVFNTHMLSDPLVQELAETKESVVQLGYSTDMIEIAAGVFNGNIDQSESENKPDNYFAAASFTPLAGFTAGLSWTSDMGEGGLEDYFTTLPDTTPYINVAGLDASLTSELGLFIVELEYVTALDEWQNHPGSSDPIKPSSWNAEVACFFEDRYGLAARYEGSSDFPGQPETRFGIAGSYLVREHVTLGLEYILSDFDGIDDDSNSITAKLALEI